MTDIVWIISKLWEFCKINVLKEIPVLEIAYQEISPALLIFLKQNCSFRSLACVTIIVWLNDFYEMYLFWDSDSFQSYFRIVVFLCETDNHHRHYLPICLPFILKNMQTRKTKTKKKKFQPCLFFFIITTIFHIIFVKFECAKNNKETVEKNPRLIYIFTEICEFLYTSA